MQRKEGYYWVKIKYSGWQVLYWFVEKNEWRHNQYVSVNEYNQYLEINENRIPAPDENRKDPISEWFKKSVHSYEEVVEFEKNVLGIEKEDLVIHNQTPVDYFKKQDDEILEAFRKNEPAKLAFMIPSGKIDRASASAHSCVKCNSAVFAYNQYCPCCHFPNTFMPE